MASTDRDDHPAVTGPDNTPPTQPTGDSSFPTLNRGAAENVSLEQGDAGNGYAPVADPLPPVAPLPVRAARRVVLTDPAPPLPEVLASGGPSEAGAPTEAPEANGRYPQGAPSTIAPGGEISAAAGTATASSSAGTAVADPPPAAEPISSQPAPVVAPNGAHPAPATKGWRAAVSRSALWRSRALLLGGVALCMAIYAQRLVNLEHAIIPAIQWYAGAILLMILAWLGT